MPASRRALRSMSSRNRARPCDWPRPTGPSSASRPMPCCCCVRPWPPAARAMRSACNWRGNCRPWAGKTRDSRPSTGASRREHSAAVACDKLAPRFAGEAAAARRLAGLRASVQRGLSELPGRRCRRGAAPGHRAARPGPRPRPRCRGRRHSELGRGAPALARHRTPCRRRPALHGRRQPLRAAGARPGAARHAQRRHPCRADQPLALQRGGAAAGRRLPAVRRHRCRPPRAGAPGGQRRRAAGAGARRAGADPERGQRGLCGLCRRRHGPYRQRAGPCALPRHPAARGRLAARQPGLGTAGRPT
mmetsp:Transcript_6774/g.28539  ORF Transcript_6774/g.28539 Transcript_6774/m.28539 type:complete len:305 (-) Transcript_6774:2717-3631(-)